MTSTTARSRWAARASSSRPTPERTWTVLGADVFGPAYTEPAGQFPQYDAVGKVRVDPNNSQQGRSPERRRGIFISYNGGTDWTGPCSTNSFPTQRQDITGLELTNMGGGDDADHRRGRRPRLRHDRAVRPRQQRRERALQRQRAVERLPELHVDRVERERLRLRHRSHRQPVHDRRGDERRQRHPVRRTRPRATSSVGSTSRSRRATRRSSTRRCSRSPRTRGGCGGAPGCQLGVWADEQRRHLLDVHGGLAGPGARRRRLRLRLPAELVRPGRSRSTRTTPTALFVDTYDVWFATRTGTHVHRPDLRLQRHERPRRPRRPARARVRAGLVEHPPDRERRRRLLDLERRHRRGRGRRRSSTWTTA